MQKSKRNNDKPRMKAGKLIQQLMLLVVTLFVFSAAMTACSSDDSLNEHPIHMNEPQEYTMTVQAKKGDMAATRALYYDGTNKKLEVKWDAGEVVKVVQNNEVIGQLTAAASDDASTTLSGTLEKAPVTDKALYFYLHNTTRNYSSQNGTIEDISAYHDFAWGTVASGSFSVDGTKVTIPAGVSFDNTPQAIVKFTLLKFEDSLPLYTTELTICDDATQQNILKTFDHLNGATTKDDLTVTSSSATNVFYVALSGISGTNLKLLAKAGSETYIYTKANVTLTDGGYYEVSVKMAPQDAIRGLFSVSSTKKVYFSKGNLQFEGDKLYIINWSVKFAAHQYDVIDNTSGNVKIDGSGTLSSYPGTVDLFGWSAKVGSDLPTYGINNSTDDNHYAGDFFDWGNAFSSPWFTLSKDQWEYLLNSRTSSTIGGTSNARWLKAQINSDKSAVKGLIIFPDVFAWNTTSMGDEPTTCNKKGENYTKTITAAQWTALESAGAVFLPAGDMRSNGTTVEPSHYLGDYWSSTSNGDKNAYCIEFDPETVLFTTYHLRHYGFSVRLVRYAN